MEHMDFYDFWRIASPEEKQDLCNKLHTSMTYMSLLAHGKRRPSRRLVDLACYVTGKKLDFAGCCED